MRKQKARELDVKGEDLRRSVRATLGTNKLETVSLAAYHPYEAATVLADNTLSMHLNERVHVMLGHLPERFNATHQSRYDSELPLEFAAAFDGRDDKACRHFLELHNASVRGYQATGDFGVLDYQGRRLPTPSDPRLRCNYATASVFRPPHTRWYTPRAVVKFIEERTQYDSFEIELITHIAGHLETDGVSAQMFQDVLLEVLERIFQTPFQKQSNKHPALCAIASMVGGKNVEELLHRSTDSYADLGVCIREPSEETMVRGLKMLAKYKRFEALRYLARAPTFEELKRANVKGAGHVWAALPWERFGTVAREHEEALLGELMKRASELDYDMLRRVLKPSQERMPLESVQAPKSAVGDAERFQQFQARLLNYFPARTLRNLLATAYPDYPNLRWLIAYAHLSQDKPLRAKLEQESALTESISNALFHTERPITRNARTNKWEERWWQT